LRGERERPVPPLALPDPTGPETVEELARSAAVQLFVQRAADVHPGFVLTAENAAAVGEICRRLDGLPLALELAAAWTRMLPPGELLERLIERPLALPAAAHDLPPRQHTLRTTIAWSYDRLEPEVRRLFRRLAAFAGGFTLDAAEYVAGRGDEESRIEKKDQAQSPTVLDLVATLGDKSLLVLRGQAEASPGSGCSRRSGSSASSGWRRAARRRPFEGRWSGSTWTSSRRRGRSCPATADRLARPDRGRARQPPGRHGVAARPPRDGSGPAAGGGLWWFWWVRGYLIEGRGWLERTLALGAGGPPELRARVLTGAGTIADAQGDHDRATACYEEALALSRTSGDGAGAAKALESLGSIAQNRGEFARAAALFEEALALFRAVGHRPGVAHALLNLGNVASCRDDLDDAAARYADALALLCALDDTRGIGTALSNLGMLAALGGSHDRAVALYAEAIALHRELGDKFALAVDLDNLGEVERHRRDLPRAAALHAEALPLFRVMGAKRGAATALANLGRVARDQGELTRAQALLADGLALSHQTADVEAVARCLESLAGLTSDIGRSDGRSGCSERRRRCETRSGFPSLGLYQPAYDRDLALARAALEPEEFAGAWAAGHAAPLAKSWQRRPTWGTRWSIRLAGARMDCPRQRRAGVGT
jgi:predicted ATPase